MWSRGWHDVSVSRAGEELSSTFLGISSGVCIMFVFALPGAVPVVGRYLHPWYHRPSAIGSAIERPYVALSHIHTQVGVLSRQLPPCSKPPSDCGSIVSKTILKGTRNKNSIEPAILNRILNRD